MGLPSLPVNRNPDTAAAAYLREGRAGFRIDPARHHVHSLHGLRTISVSVGEPHRTVNARRRRRKYLLAGETRLILRRDRIQARNGRNVVHGQLIRIGVAIVIGMQFRDR